MKRALSFALTMVLAAGLGYAAFAGQFLIRTPDTLLWQSKQYAILVLHNSTDKLVSQIVLDFPDKVQVEHFSTNDGVMEMQQQGTHVVLSGALLENGFIQLQWQPGDLPPLTAVIHGDSGSHTITFSDPANWVASPTEVEEIGTATAQEALVTRFKGGTASVLTLKFDAAIKHASAIGVGCTPKLTINKDTIVLSGVFPNKSTVDIKWGPNTAHLVMGAWNDRPLYIANQSEGITFNMSLHTSSADVTTGEAVHFSAPSTTGVQQYHWNFGDGTTATGPIVTHAFIHGGQYLVTLSETEANGKVHLRQKLVLVRSKSGSMPLSGIVPGADPEGPYGPYNLDFEDEHWVSQGDDSGYWVDTYGHTVEFDASASYGHIVKYQWDFGDGHTAITKTPHVVHNYEFSFKESEEPQDNEFIRVPVTLTVTDDHGKTSTANTYVEVVNPLYYREWE